MKKLNLLLSLFIMAVAMTSCLDAGSRNYSESAFAYIVQDNSGLVYARTSTGKFITSNEIKAMMPGDFKFLSYSFDEVNGSETLENITIDNVTVSNNVLNITKEGVRNVPAPQPTSKFTGIDPPIYSSEPVYFGDYWIVTYGYKHAEGEKPMVTFYKRENTEANSTDVKIDVRITGISPTGTVAKADAVALNMAPIRAMYEGESTTAVKDLKVTFYYYINDKTEETASQTYTFRVKGD